MSLSGNVINGNIVLDQPAALPHGTRVEVAVRAAGQPFDEELGDETAIASPRAPTSCRQSCLVTVCARLLAAASCESVWPGV